MNLDQVKTLFMQAGVNELYAKPLAENDNSKNQIYFAGAVDLLNTFPSRKVFAENNKEKGPTFKARMDFGWLLQNGSVCPAPGAQLILYSQYPEVRFSGFLRGCECAPTSLMMARKEARSASPEVQQQLKGRVLFLGVTSDRRVIGYVAPGNSEVAFEFNSQNFAVAFVVFRKIPLPTIPELDDSRAKLLAELGRIHRLGWIESKQLAQNGTISECIAPQCGGFTLEAELGIPKNSRAEPDFLGWEVKQYSVSNFNNVNLRKPITLLTPEPNGGFYQTFGPAEFVRRFGYNDKCGRADRLNFGGIHVFGQRQSDTNLTLTLHGYDAEHNIILDADGKLQLVTESGEIAASWSFARLLEHWSRKHTRVAYVPSQCRKVPQRQYRYGNKVRLAEGTNPLYLLKALANGFVYYDPGIKLEQASQKGALKRRSQFRVSSRDVGELYKEIRVVEV